MHTLLDFYKFFSDFGFLAILIGCSSLIGISFLPFIINYFFWNFPTQFKFAEKKWVKKIIIILPAFISVLAILFAILAFNGIIGQMIFIYGLESLGYFALFANVTALIALIFQYRRIKSKEKRKPVLLMLIAVTFGLAVGLYAAQIAPAIADTLFNSPEYYTPIIL